MRIVVPVDAPSAAEAVAVARALSEAGVGFAIGARLLTRSGAAIVAAVAPFGPVLADARLAGKAGAVVAAARTLAATGAAMITLGTGVDPGTVERCAAAVRSYGARVVVVPVPPEADAASTDLVTMGSGRGRAVSRWAAAIADLDVDLLGVVADIGVVAQVAPAVGVLAWGVSTPEAVEDCRARGAKAAVLADDVAGGRDPLDSIWPFITA